MSKKVLIVAPVHEVLPNALQDMGYTCDLRESFTQQDAMEVAGAYEGLITSTRLQIDRAFLDKATDLKWVGRMGSGMEVIDVPYATEKGVLCFSSPEGNANAVAEQALGMLLGLQHKICSAHQEMQQGIWQREENRGLEIEGLTAAVIGFGNNGSAFARKLRAMQVQVLALDKFKKGFAEEGIVECEDLQRIYNEADIVSFHLPLNEETRHYFNDEFVSHMVKPFVLLNLSRGSIVSQDSLYKGLKSGKVRAAGLDVWEREPVSKMEGIMQEQYQELIRMPHVIATPHIGGYTVQALYKMSWFLAEKIRKAVH